MGVGRLGVIVSLKMRIMQEQKVLGGGRAGQNRTEQGRAGGAGRVRSFLPGGTAR